MYKAFTIDYDRVVNVVKMKCGISKAISTQELQQGTPHPQVLEADAIIDTGATHSAITPELAERLGLYPTGKCQNGTAAGVITSDVYTVNIILPNEVGFAMMPVTCNSLRGTDMLIGMDLIAKGDICISRHEGKTRVTFQVESSHDTDYVSEIEKYKRMHNVWIKSRNNKCPCGSGKRWEECHGA